MALALSARLRRYVEVIRLRPHDTTTDDGRARERYRRVALTAFTAAAARGTTILVALVTVPLCIDFLGNERYGLYLTLSSLFAFAYVADLGITAGLQISIANADARDDRDEARRLVGNALQILLTTTGVAAVLLGVLYAVVDWPGVFNVSSPLAVDEAGAAAIAFGATWLLNILGSVVTRICYGYQDGFVTNLWQVLGSILSVIAVVVAIELEAGLPVLVLALAGTPALAMLFNTIQVLGWRRPWLRPRRGDGDPAVRRRLIRDGGWFLLGGLGYIAMMMSSNVLIAHTLGPEVVPEFGVPYRVASVLTMVFAVIVTSFLPAYAEAQGRGDRGWVRRALVRSLTISTALGAAGALIYVGFGKSIIALWVGDSVHPSYLTLSGFAAWALLVGLSNGVNSFVQGTGGLRAHGLQWLAAALLAAPLQYLAIRLLGVAGAPWGLFATELICRLIPGVVYYQRWLGGAARGAG